MELKSKTGIPQKALSPLPAFYYRTEQNLKTWQADKIYAAPNGKTVIPESCFCWLQTKTDYFYSTPQPCVFYFKDQQCLKKGTWPQCHILLLVSQNIKVFHPTPCKSVRVVLIQSQKIPHIFICLAWQKINFNFNSLDKKLHVFTCLPAWASRTSEEWNFPVS